MATLQDPMGTLPDLSFIDPSNMCICGTCGKGVLKKECYTLRDLKGIYFPESYECKIHFENTKQNYQNYQSTKYYYEAPPPPSGLYEKAISSYKSIKNWLFPEPLVK